MARILLAYPTTNSARIMSIAQLPADLLSFLKRRILRLPVWLLLIIIVSAAAATALLASRTSPLAAFRGPHCRGSATCFTDSVTYIVDGDTLDVGSTRIRLALVNTPEVGEPGYDEAKQFTAQTCPIGTHALVDEDDGQTGGSYGRMIALVYCQDVNLNAELLSSGHAVLVTYYCSVSEFADEAWTGCP